MKKVAEYLWSGRIPVWVVFPKRRQVLIFRASMTIRSLPAKGRDRELPELPGFVAP